MECRGFLGSIYIEFIDHLVESLFLAATVLALARRLLLNAALFRLIRICNRFAIAKQLMIIYQDLLFQPGTLNSVQSSRALQPTSQSSESINQLLGGFDSCH